MTGCTEKKPEGIPYFYQNRGIAPTPGNDWVCDNGVWVWRASSQEKAQEPEASEKFEAQFIDCKNPQGLHKIQGEYRQVCKDWRGYYYVENFQKYNLSLGWVYENITKANAEAILPKQDPLTSVLKDPTTGKWAGGDVGAKIRAPFDKIATKLENISAGGGIMRAFQLSAIVLMLFVALIIYIIFVRGKGASGVTVGQVG